MAIIGLYGGTFNPIHQGHIGVCRQAVEQLKLDCLYLAPTYVPPHKAAPDLASGEDRLAMCRIAVEGLPHVEVEDYELCRGGISYTIDTLEYMRREHSAEEFYLLMGSDNFLTFQLWRCWREIGLLATLAVAPRGTEDRSELCRKAQKLGAEGIRTVFLQNPVRVVSSTEIRSCIRSGNSTDLVPEGVMRYITEHVIYRGGKNE